MLLDALQPTGIFSIALDKYNVLPALGLMAKTQPTAVVQALEAGVLTDLGWVIVPTGKGQSGQSIMTGVVESEGQGQFDLDIEYGAIDTTVLSTGQIANVMLNPHKRIDIGFGEGKSKKITVRGGAVGLVIDGRGRPLTVPDSEERYELVRKWYWDVGADRQIAMDTFIRSTIINPHIRIQRKRLLPTNRHFFAGRVHLAHVSWVVVVIEYLVTVSHDFSPNRTLIENYFRMMLLQLVPGLDHSRFPTNCLLPSRAFNAPPIQSCPYQHHLYTCPTVVIIPAVSLPPF